MGEFQLTAWIIPPTKKSFIHPCRKDTEQYDFVLVGMVEEEYKVHAGVTYIDADESNTTMADGSVFTTTGPEKNSGYADSLWHEYTLYGNGGSCYTAGDGGAENVPSLKTTTGNLADGVYDVFAYFWSNPVLNWGLRGGFSESDMLCFSKQSAQYAEPGQFTDSVKVIDEINNVLLYQVYIGRRQVTGGAGIEVFIDNYDSSYSGGIPSRTTYDGVGVVEVINIITCQDVINAGHRLPADLNSDCSVKISDFALMAGQWLSSNPIDVLPDYSPDLVDDSIIDITDLAVFASQWLECNDPTNNNCTNNW